MKRRMGLLAILLPLLLLVPLLPAALLPAAAAVAAMDAVRLTASADYDRASQAVRISGNVSSGKGSWISVQLLNEVGNPVYFDQIDAGERGDFALLLPIPEPDGGPYELKLGASGLDSVTKLAVPVGQSPEPKPNEPGPDPEPENPQPGAGGPSGPAPGSQTGSPGGHVQTGDREVVFRAAGVKETDGQGRTVSVVGVTSRQLAEWLAGKSSMTVIVQSDSMEAVQELRVPAETLRQVYGSGSLVKLVFQNEAAAYEIRLQELLSATANEIPAGDAQIIVRMERMAGPAADGITAKLLQSGSSTVGSPVAFELSILTDAGVRKIGGLTGFGEKRMRLAAAPDTAKTVAILFDPATGTFRPLPTVFEYERGVWTAVIKHSGGGIYAVVRNDRQFADVSGHWSRSDVELLANRLIVNGVGDSTFAPDGSVTRAEFAAMLVRALGLHDAGRTVRFTDVQTSDWHAGVVLAAVQAGIVEGYENGEFRPDRQVSRQEMTVMLQRAAQYSGITPIAELPAYGQAASRFADSGSTRPWAEQAMAEAIKRGWLQGRSEFELAPDGTATRAEAVVMLKRLLFDAAFINP